MFFHGLSSISLVKNKKIQALVKIRVFLIQKLECRVNRPFQKGFKPMLNVLLCCFTPEFVDKKHLKFDQGLDFLIFYQGNRGENEEKPKENHEKIRTH